MENRVHRRIVVTGMGLVSPLACDAKISWERLIGGLSGVKNYPLLSMVIHPCI